ncbi:unnamed protein product [Hydatigera taeniaeformis]|uniref:UBX domain-containing protein 4 n=1 Tax=Hydatigena taeniaeformis TaxID=6205 RepID=A0A0R3X5D1_HYDTA|nr:unnamed protein product [Hydatigera taeniaeformis]
MNWYSGDVSQCIKEVKATKKLLLVFSRDNDHISSESSTALNAKDVAMHCQNVVCLQLQSGSVSYHHFESVYNVPSLPCIHIISPSGLVLSVKTTGFSVEEITSWLSENLASFESAKGLTNEVREVQEFALEKGKCDNSPEACVPDLHFPLSNQVNSNLASSDEPAAPRLEEKEAALELPNALPEDEFASSPLISSYRPDSLGGYSDLGCQRDRETVQGEGILQTEWVSSEARLEADTSVLPYQSGNNLNERIEHARQLLEARRQDKAVKAFQETHESELKRRDLGRDMAKFKRQKQEQEIRERLEEQKREKAEKQAARQRILTQIELDRRDRLGISAPTVAAPKCGTAPLTSAVDPNEVRLQLRLPDGSHMVGVFAADAHLGLEVRQYISARVEGTPTSGTLAVAPISDIVRASFAPVLASGFTFRQTRPNPPRHFSPDDETAKTLRELDLWPSAVLMLHSDKCKPTTDGALAGCSYNVLSRMAGLVWGSVQSIGDMLFYFGDGLIQLGRSTWQILFNTGSGRTVGQARAANPTTSTRPLPSTDERFERSAYRRQVCCYFQLYKANCLISSHLTYNQRYLRVVSGGWRRHNGFYFQNSNFPIKHAMLITAVFMSVQVTEKFG